MERVLRASRRIAQRQSRRGVFLAWEWHRRGRGVAYESGDGTTAHGLARCGQKSICEQLQRQLLAARPDLVSKPLDDRIARLYLDLLGRPARPHEIELGRKFVENAPTAEGYPSPWEKYAQVLLLTNEFLFLD